MTDRAGTTPPGSLCQTSSPHEEYGSCPGVFPESVRSADRAVISLEARAVNAHRKGLHEATPDVMWCDVCRAIAEADRG